MSHRIKISPPLGHYAECAKHVSSIRKLEDACDEAVFQYHNNPKPDREKILNEHLADAEQAIQYHIRALNKLESTDFDPVEESTSRIKKSRDKLSNPEEVYKIKEKIEARAKADIETYFVEVKDHVDKSSKKFKETFVGKLFADIPLPEASKLRKASPLDHQATGNFRSNSVERYFGMGDIGNKPPDPIQLELLKTQKAILHHLQNQERPKPEVHNHSDAPKEAENQNYPPSPTTRKTQVLDKLEEHYRACLKSNGKQLIRFRIFKKTEEFQKILEWGKKKLGVTVEPKTIKDRMRAVNKEWEINKRGAPTASELKPKTKEPIPKKEKMDLDEEDKIILADDF